MTSSSLPVVGETPVRGHFSRIITSRFMDARPLNRHALSRVARSAVGAGRGLTRRGEPAHADEGSALVEAVVVIAVLLLPLLWVATALIRVEAASFAVRAAAREAARTYVTASSTGAGAERANVAARLAFEDQRAPIGMVSVTCTSRPCLTPGGDVTARAQTHVGLPFVPTWLSGRAGLEITLSSEHTEKVERYGGAR